MDGQVPDLYALCKAAKWLGVAPWDLEERRPLWKNAALHFMQAETDPAVLKAQQAMARMRARADAVRRDGSRAI